ncbi:MAG: efflux RND transporter periplasmic adaptor subunit [Candidatus Caenarcaniphilales bacterium]|nr:efflux RND transporter periplasmic adaptor subunit [Candidatus Caenarcaniphilales bacterium]
MFKRVFPILASLIISVTILSSCSQQNPPEKPQRPIAIKYEAAKRMDLPKVFETVAELKAYREISVSAEKAGQISKILVREGDWVAENTPLVRIKGDDVIADLEKARLDYESFKELYDEGAISKLEFLNYDASLKKLEAEFDRLLIKSISSGIVGKIIIDPGDFVSVGDPILDLVKIHPLRVSYSIPEKLIPLVEIGQSVELRTPVYPDEVFQAKVDFISPLVDKDTKTILVRASIVSDPKKLKPNQYIKIKQKVKDKKNVLVVREEAVYLEQGQEYVYIAKEAEEEGFFIAERREIQTGSRKPGFVEIYSGIKEGEAIVYAGLYSIYPGAKLLPSEVAATIGPGGMKIK